MKSSFFACAAILAAVVVGCGGRTADTADGGATGSGATGSGGATGGTVTGSGGSITGGTTTGTGGSTGGTGGTGAGGAGGSATDWQACSGAGQCTVMLDRCCGSCGTQPISELIGVNTKFVDIARTKVCPAPAPCPACVSTPNPNVGARCTAGKCEVFDVRTVPEFSKCAVNADCRLRKGLECCECSAKGDWTAVSVAGAMVLTAAVCAPDTACTDCAPQPPPDVRAICSSGRCEMVILPR